MLELDQPGPGQPLRLEPTPGVTLATTLASEPRNLVGHVTLFLLTLLRLQHPLKSF
jgi:hypothetical protein